MKFEKYVTKDGAVNDLKGSELFDHTKKITFNVNKGSLETDINTIE